MCCALFVGRCALLLFQNVLFVVWSLVLLVSCFAFVVCCVLRVVRSCLFGVWCLWVGVCCASRVFVVVCRYCSLLVIVGFFCCRWYLAWLIVGCCVKCARCVWRSLCFVCGLCVCLSACCLLVVICHVFLFIVSFVPLRLSCAFRFLSLAFVSCYMFLACLSYVMCYWVGVTCLLLFALSSFTCVHCGLFPTS